MTDGDDHTAGNDKIFYSGNAGAMTELALGAANTYLIGNGATSAPTFSALDVSHDTTPTLGGNLSLNGKTIYSPRVWTGKTKYGYTDTPQYRTCICPVKRDKPNARKN